MRLSRASATLFRVLDLWNERPQRDDAYVWSFDPVLPCAAINGAARNGVQAVSGARLDSEKYSLSMAIFSEPTKRPLGTRRIARRRCLLLSSLLGEPELANGWKASFELWKSGALETSLVGRAID